MTDHPETQTAGPLAGWTVIERSLRPAVSYAGGLLTRLGAQILVEETDGSDALTVDAGRDHELLWVRRRVGDTPDHDWAECGAMTLTGPADGPPLCAPGQPASAARGAGLAIEVLSTVLGHTVSLDGGRLLGERAAVAGYSRRGHISAGGSCRLVRADDGWLAVNLPRAEDVDAIPAWLEVVPGDDPWDLITRACSAAGSAELADRAQTLGLPVAGVPQPEEASAYGIDAVEGFPLPPWLITEISTAETSTTGNAPAEGITVVDLSSMWAGPLCANLLSLAGLRVVKVESTRRPDGARYGPRRFFDLLHAGHESVALDFARKRDLERLRSLLDVADVVIEASRPRALAQLGVDRLELLADRPGKVWVSITGYGSVGPAAQRVAFGDDAAAAAGLVCTAAGGTAVFCGDAIADPIAGLHAATATLAMLAGGRGGLVDVALCGAVNHTLGDEPVRPATSRTAEQSAGGWVLPAGDRHVEVGAPVAREPTGHAADLGEHTEAVLHEFAIR
ncbi:MAG: Formyl-CoA:oxalate CoA-transferase [Acidimicrobiales bacterium]|nr:MAG: CoA transferase [Actinomycetota bacterium]MBV6508585.1 Formyl-CoA:oxalate CoA-transferase [Acidimicrobiales bacterium]RIK05111.1 MAG: CoA transferase [Acidobacteriota bacterium]